MTFETVDAFISYHNEDNDFPFTGDQIEAIRVCWRARQAEVDRWKKAIEGLTPSGSEFVNDPEFCAAYIRKRTEYPRMIIELRERVKELESALQRHIDLRADGIKNKI